MTVSDIFLPWILSASINSANAPINGLPQDGGGGGGVGQPRGNLTFSGFQTSISPPLGHHCKSNFPPPPP